MTKNLPSTKPYMIRAIHEWCTDNGFTPHVAVQVDGRVRVPRGHARDGQIVLNIGYEATGGLQIGNDLISFQARFGGVARDISFPSWQRGGDLCAGKWRGHGFRAGKLGERCL